MPASRHCGTSVYHRFYNPFCEHCVAADATRKPRYKGTLALGPKPEGFGKCITGDHLTSRNSEIKEYVPDEDDDMFPGASNGVVMYDRGTDDLEVYPVATRSAPETIEAFQHWAGPDDKIESFYADNAPELKAAARKLEWRMSTSTPGVPKTNGL